MQKINKKTIIFISIITIIIISIYNIFIKDKVYIENNSNISISNEEEKNTKEEHINKTSNTESKEKIIIYIAGAVKNEGIYELDENSRIADGIEKAGGLTEDANIKNINLAYILEDGMKVYIPHNSDNNEIKDNDVNIYTDKEKDNKNTSKNTNSNNKNNKININTATQTELETLPGIGPSIATKIINYRKENGKFANIEDIKKVSGIGDNKYEKIKDIIKV